MTFLWQRFANINSPILITGNSGSGKSSVAKSLFLHSRSHRSVFVTAHLASLKEELLESELFGHQKGAFTGAIENRFGYLQVTGNGTLFLDEVGELSLESQKKLLYLLEEKKYKPVGASIEKEFNGRIILATNKNLKSLLEKGLFREDLYFRLMLFQIHLPDLKVQPKEEIKRSIDLYFDQMKQKYSVPHLKMTKELEDFLYAHPWPGNYRQLKNCCEYLVAMNKEALIDLDQLPMWMNDRATCELVLKNDDSKLWGEDYYLALEEFECRYLKKWLSLKAGRINQTARDLGISKTALIYKCKKYGLSENERQEQLNPRKYGDVAA